MARGKCLKTARPQPLCDLGLNLRLGVPNTLCKILLGKAVAASFKSRTELPTPQPLRVQDLVTSWVYGLVSGMNDHHY